MQARILQINVSDGGVPKQPVRSAEATYLGLTGDRQQDTEHHGGPDRALCLYSLDRILALQAEGHPVYPGSIGENLTIAGLDWARVVPGAKLALGEQVLIEVTGYAAPCRTIQSSFTGHEFGRVSARTHPGWSRVYARVLIPGRLTAGDRVEWAD
jgi:MOSC domain-containing protein YiiM